MAPRTEMTARATADADYFADGGRSIVSVLRPRFPGWRERPVLVEAGAVDRNLTTNGDSI